MGLCNIPETINNKPELWAIVEIILESARDFSNHIPLHSKGLLRKHERTNLFELDANIFFWPHHGPATWKQGRYLYVLPSVKQLRQQPPQQVGGWILYIGRPDASKSLKVGTQQ
jgi:hypothetical protein